MKLTLEYAIIGVVALALIYYMVKYRNVLTMHRNLVKDVSSIPDRDHPELKAVKEKHIAPLVMGVVGLGTLVAGAIASDPQ
tara:strand:- start:1293 stop:1535 length:243 start_codon:yes stop_codon:yes gene_type:complete